eukprot:XP_024303129.1 uncharacterized protein LOC101929400 isoform X2 [Homo sapiens]
MAGPEGRRRRTSLPKRRGWGCSWRGEAHSPRTARTGRTRRCRARRRPAPRQVATAKERNSPRVLSSLGFPTTSKSWKTQGAGRAPEPWPALPAAPKPLASPEAGMAGPGGRRTTSLPKRRGWGCSWRGEAHSPRTARTGRTRRGQAGRRPAPRQVATAEDSYGNTLFEEPMKQCQAGTRISSDFFEEESPFLHSQAMSEWIKKNRVPFYEILSA